MGRGVDRQRPAKEAVFKRSWLEHKDLTRAWVEAFGPGHKQPEKRASAELSKPYMQAAIAELESRNQKVINAIVSREDQAIALMRQDVHPLEARQNRILYLARIAHGEETVTRQTVTENGDVVEWQEGPSFKDRVAAMKLLGLMYGDHTARLEINAKEGVHFVSIDNGMGPTPQEPSTDMGLCKRCDTVYSLDEGHECGKALASGK